MECHNFQTLFLSHRLAVDDLEPVEFSVPESGDRVCLRVLDCAIEGPRIADGTGFVRETRVFPSEARQSGGSYKGPCRLRFSYTVNGVKRPEMEKYLGNVPIMLK